jgi:hypothetical protein
LLSASNPAGLARHHIFPKEFLEQNLDLDDPDSREVQISNLANITFIQAEINKELEDTPPDQYLKNYVDSAAKHFIPTAKDAWSMENYDHFLETRFSQIQQSAMECFPDIFE